MVASTGMHARSGMDLKMDRFNEEYLSWIPDEQQEFGEFYFFTIIEASPADEIWDTIEALGEWHDTGDFPEWYIVSWIAPEFIARGMKKVQAGQKVALKGIKKIVKVDMPDGSAIKKAVRKSAEGTGNSTKKLLPREGDIGTYKDLIKRGSRGDNITPHHMPSAQYMKNNYSVPKNKGVSMNMEQPSPGVGGRHRKTRSYGKGSDLMESPRDALARDIMDARRIYQNDGLYTPEMRRSLQEAIDMNKRLYPEIFKK